MYQGVERSLSLSLSSVINMINKWLWLTGSDPDVLLRYYFPHIGNSTHITLLSLRGFIYVPIETEQIFLRHSITVSAIQYYAVSFY